MIARAWREKWFLRWHLRYLDKVSLGETVPFGGLGGRAEGLLVRFWVTGSPFTEISAKLFSPVVRKDPAGGILPR